MTLPNYEKLGVFYLGREYDLDADQLQDDLVLYDSKDLTTHAVCVGMTGSGKTGLCLSLLEEAAIDHIPVIAIDPKGDLGNLLLTFPDLKGEDFAPWIDEAEALRHGETKDDYAQQTADRWREGLADWDQAPERIAMLKEAADVAIYTPGSDAGLPISVLQSFTAPSAAILNDSDAFRDRVMSAVSSLLTLLKIDADPISSREHILLSTIISAAWKEGRNLTIPQILHEIQQPPFNKVGFLDLETFFPEKDRFQFAILVNNLLASPGFSAWMQGEPLNIERLLVTKQGKPRISIMSIAHLSDSERMFFVTVLLNELLTWTRSQPGTSALRAILYMDEVFGYFPPTANPPSKLPMLTLLKQARAFGVGVVLATQNPVDLDYKGLANTGTWFLGRLQTERDKARVLDGLEGVAGNAGAAFDRNRIGEILAGLGKRKFLLHNVHEGAPVVFQTRWALSYLRGPLTRQQIADLMYDRKQLLLEQQKAEQQKNAQKGKGEHLRTAAAPLVPAEDASELASNALPPSLPDSIVQRYVVPVDPIPKGSTLVYHGSLLGLVKVHYADSKSEVDLWREAAFLVETYETAVVDVWELCELIWEPEVQFDANADEDALFAELPGDMSRAGKYRTWKKQLRDHIYREITLDLWEYEPLDAYSAPEESEAGFRLRIVQQLREKNDLDVEKLKAKYAARFTSARDRVLRAEERVKREQAQYEEASYSSWISIGSSILGALMGRKVVSKTNVSKAATAMRSTGRTSSQKADVERAIERLEVEKEKLQKLEDQFEREVEKLEAGANPEELNVETYAVRPRKTDITIAEVALAWLPFASDAEGRLTPLFEIGSEIS
ncbi:helicase HerA domain-containing protein [Rubinisphaera brasiliensis]|uniref:Helicase HerA central domain-containing protein n=1 Tax=Rubinisphaera brasiliensis (strain ATCC 49424 / DSM 5305 / JCM 21570 / IAM 15109 / NBRC 103401 / IFAM 1448) TaxID=756272 RepID=F0SLJ7_RUBBR|nr:DUF87 domain-containing protein [Rubinisphaera brasiliensis]ADY57680.1 hypothetical protein Plabr_0050 [Rubinisphaera brasiliensis DSM 5305]